jgi:hypothetical protein
MRRFGATEEDGSLVLVLWRACTAVSRESLVYFPYFEK